MVVQLYLSFVLALAISAVSVTISVAKVFEPLREWVADKNDWIGRLIKCPYCTSHWLSFVAVAIYRPRLIVHWWPLDFAVTAFAIVALAAFSSGLILKAMDAASPKSNFPPLGDTAVTDSIFGSHYDGILDKIE